MTQRVALFLLTIAVFLIEPSMAFSQTFKIATLVPENSFWMEAFRKHAAQIETQTNKRVRFKLYPGGVMGDDRTVYRKIRSGQLHGAAVTNGSLNRLYPDIQLYSLIMKFSTLEEVDYIREKMDVKLMEGLEKTRVVPMGFAEMGFAYLMSKNNISDLEDLRTNKAWIPEDNNVAESAMNALSIPAIPLTIADVLVGLQTGLVDVVAASPVGSLALQWHTQIHYVVDLPISYIFGVFILDKKTLQNISVADQAIVRKELAQAMKDIDTKNRQDNISALQAIYNLGIKKVTFNHTAINELNHSVLAANDQLISKGKMSSSLVKELNTYLKYYRNLDTPQNLISQTISKP